MVSKPIADYAVGPDLHAAVFLVRGTVKNTNFLAGAVLFTRQRDDAQVGLVLVPEVGSSKNIVAKRPPLRSPGGR